MTASGWKNAANGKLPWQLRLFSKKLKKQQKLRLLLDQVGDLAARDCLLITCGDNDGATNWHLREHGGRWSWMEVEADHVEDIEALLGEEVRLVEPDRLPVPDASFDTVVTIDVHEHLQDCGPLNAELARILRPGGRVIVTTPNGDPWKPVTVLKHLVGMTKDTYGHAVIGYGIREHEAMLSAVGLETVATASYSHFFTELLELAINFAYVKVLSKRSKVEVSEGTIAPSNYEQLRAVEKQYRMYSLVYPLLLAISKLDLLLGWLTGYAVSVVARRPA